MLKYLYSFNIERPFVFRKTDGVSQVTHPTLAFYRFERKVNYDVVFFISKTWPPSIFNIYSLFQAKTHVKMRTNFIIKYHCLFNL